MTSSASSPNLRVLRELAGRALREVGSAWSSDGTALVVHVAAVPTGPRRQDVVLVCDVDTWVLALDRGGQPRVRVRLWGARPDADADRLRLLARAALHDAVATARPEAGTPSTALVPSARASLVRAGVVTATALGSLAVVGLMVMVAFLSGLPPLVVVGLGLAGIGLAGATARRLGDAAVPALAGPVRDPVRPLRHAEIDAPRVHPELLALATAIAEVEHAPPPPATAVDDLAPPLHELVAAPRLRAVLPPEYRPLLGR
ncbi:MAG: hypothetical protein H6732_15975 [Alphaproteobacteria bacterium]|nr:hypothetical protein [Alphaproteobacteria bacterium]